MINSNQTECDRFLDLLNQVLDGDLPGKALVEDPHYAICSECRPLTMMVRMIGHGGQRPAVLVPSGLTDRISSAAVRDYRFRQNIRWTVRLGGAALAAGVLFAIGAQFLPQTVVETPGPRQTVAVISEPAEARKVTQSLSQVGTALVSLSRRTADESLSPAMSLFSPPKLTQRESTPSEESKLSISELPEAFRTGLEPVASTPLRAFNYFVRDLTTASVPKSKS